MIAVSINHSSLKKSKNAKLKCENQNGHHSIQIQTGFWRLASPDCMTNKLSCIYSKKLLQIFVTRTQFRSAGSSDEIPALFLTYPTEDLLTSPTTTLLPTTELEPKSRSSFFEGLYSDQCEVARNFRYISVDAFTCLYRTLIKVTVGISNPFREGLVDKIEAVQKRATRLITACSHLACKERLKFPKLL